MTSQTTSEEEHRGNRPAGRAGLRRKLLQHVYLAEAAARRQRAWRAGAVACGRRTRRLRLRPLPLDVGAEALEVRRQRRDFLVGEPRRPLLRLHLGGDRLRLPLDGCRGRLDLPVGVGHADGAEGAHLRADQARVEAVRHQVRVARHDRSRRGRGGAVHVADVPQRRVLRRRRGGDRAPSASSPTGRGGRRRIRRPSSTRRNAPSRSGTAGPSASGSCSSPPGCRCRARRPRAACRASRSRSP